MIPIRDVNPARRSALVTGAIVAVSAYVFFFVQPADPIPATRFLYAHASIPCEVVTGEPLSLAEIRSGLCVPGDGPGAFPDKNVWWSVVASIFFHGNIGHLVGNLWILWIFGNNVEDAMGRLRYLIFYLVSGVAASTAHILLNPGSTVPVVGASGAIAGVMGAYLVLYPTARVVSIIPPLFFLPFELPAVLYLGLWFFGQFGLAGTATNIAWEAHVAGFLVGAVYALFSRRRFLAHHYGWT